MNLPTLRQFKYLVALRDHLHFSRAAEACFVTQSTLSAGIQELESLLGSQLVERSKRSVLFTPLGEEVTERARGLLNEAAGIVELVEARKAPLSGVVRLGVIPTIAPFLLPRVLPALRRAYPDLKLHLKEDLSQTVCADLMAGRLDLVLLALPYHCGEVETEILFEDPFLAAYPAGEAPPGKTVSPESLDRSRLLLLEEGHCLRDHALAVCGEAAPRLAHGLLGTSLHTLVQMIDNGLGISLLPQMALDSGLLKGTEVETRELAGDAPARLIGLVWRKRSPNAEDFHRLATFLSEHQKELAGAA
jgi:LysR family hydrogen peroxide-inducible transcriptional activator